MTSSTVLPRLVVAAPASGSGKTTVATGLMAALTARGLAVSPHKVGPDYIDPGYHALATGRVGRNLDAYLCGPELVAPLFLHGARGCDLAVVEGVMGLFDGAAGEGELASTAQVAKVLGAPVVLVVDASAQSRSVAALVHGFVTWDPEVRVGGVILNKVGSERHESLLREALDSVGVPVLGVLRRTTPVETPSRHLGLVPVAERGAQAVEAVAAMGAMVAAGCDLEAVVALARSAGPVSGAAWDAAEAVRVSPPPPHPFPTSGGSAPHTPLGISSGAGASGLVAQFPAPLRGAGNCASDHEPPAPANAPEPPEPEGASHPHPVVALASGPAFTFSYAEHAELLRAAGADVVPFDPLRDERLPDRTAGIVVGGGFPEVYAAELSANEPLRKAVGEFARAGGPVAAECAGLLYLCRELDGSPMCGVLDATARMSERLTLGYRDAVAVTDSSLAPAGTRMRGHEFHRTVVEPHAGESPAWGVRGAERRLEGFVRRGVHASYLHTHWAATPGVAHRFVERCRTS
ncbi:cobyrinate a,c-diamide synthase [Streptomyces sp. NBC_00670]|nr:cobyrinate a,c-diamide synthase [Streptomyces sp. NBC_00670]